MLIKFNFKNFKSFKNENCLDMEAASIKEHEYNTIDIKDKKYLKVAAIYGANASGKTNVLEAFEFMKEKLMINDDTNMNSNEVDNYYNFSFDEKSKNEPIALEVTFLAKNKKIYQYGFEIKNKNIVSEWLYVKKINKRTPIFDRDENKVKFNKSYKAKINKFDVDSSSLFLSLYRKIEKDNEDFKSVYDWFLNSYYLDLGNPKFENKINRLISSKIVDDKEYRKRLVEFIKVFDLGIDDIDVKIKEKSLLSSINQSINLSIKTISVIVSTVCLFSLLLFLGEIIKAPYRYLIEGLIEFSYPCLKASKLKTISGELIVLFISLFPSLSIIFQSKIINKELDIRKYIFNRLLIAFFSVSFYYLIFSY